MNKDEIIKVLLERCVRCANEQSSCFRRKTYCILLDKDFGTVAEGANGSPLQLGDCTADDSICPDRYVEAGTGDQNTKCYGIHAEIRALKSCHAIHQVVYALCLKAPCYTCTLALMLTPCTEIIFKIPSTETLNKELWEKVGLKWVQHVAN